jgi:hypothetical protein
MIEAARRRLGKAGRVLTVLSWIPLVSGCGSIPSAEAAAAAPELGGCDRGGGAPLGHEAQWFEDRVDVDEPTAAVLDRAARYLGRSGMDVETLGRTEVQASGRGTLRVSVRLTEVTPMETAGLVCGYWTVPEALGGGDVAPLSQPGEREEPSRPSVPDHPNRGLLTGLVRAMENKN